MIPHVTDPEILVPLLNVGARTPSEFRSPESKIQALGGLSYWASSSVNTEAQLHCTLWNNASLWACVMVYLLHGGPAGLTPTSFTSITSSKPKTVGAHWVSRTLRSLLSLNFWAVNTGHIRSSWFLLSNL